MSASRPRTSMEGASSALGHATGFAPDKLPSRSPLRAALKPLSPHSPAFLPRPSLQTPACRRCSPSDTRCSIPALSITTYNTNGLSAHATSGEPLERQRRVLANINSLASSCDVLLLQETRGSNLSQIRHLLAVNNFSHPFLNPNPDSAHSGGTAMLVSQRVAASFKLVHEVLIPGVAQLLRFVPLPSNRLCSHPFLVLNTYLQSGDPATAMSQM
jgi:hypothetical protein